MRPAGEAQTKRKFEELFRGRTDIWFDCLHDRRGRGDLTDRLWDSHLNGRQPIGVYDLMPDSTVWWSATDIDVDEPMWVRMLQQMWEFYGFTTWAEASRSKGWHLWLFHESLVSATTARNAWLWVHEVSGVPATEVYPKQVDGSTTFGNCIRLPYPRDHKRGRQVAYESDLATPIALDDFLDRALASRTSNVVKLEELAASYSFPEYAPESAERPDFKPGRIASDQRISMIYRGQGRVEQGERDNTFWCLACFAAGIGHSEAEIMEICTQVYDKQTDQSGFSLADALRKVPRAYAVVQRRRPNG